FRRVAAACRAGDRDVTLRVEVFASDQHRADRGDPDKGSPLATPPARLRALVDRPVLADHVDVGAAWLRLAARRAARLAGSAAELAMSSAEPFARSATLARSGASTLARTAAELAGSSAEPFSRSAATFARSAAGALAGAGATELAATAAALTDPAAAATAATD